MRWAGLSGILGDVLVARRSEQTKYLIVIDALLPTHTRVESRPHISSDIEGLG